MCWLLCTISNMYDNVVIIGASLDFGVFLCGSCAGGHRGFGPSITRVKSTKLD